MINNVKARCRSVAETLQVLNCLIANGHAWRGGGTHNTLAEYEVNNLIGIYIKDTDENDFYQQKSAITFETCIKEFWCNTGYQYMSPEQILEYYKLVPYE
jgi:hypothetical protein